MRNSENSGRRPWTQGSRPRHCQPACKPGFVWKFPRTGISAATIHLGCPLPDTSSNQPGRLVWKPTSSQVAPLAAAPIWSCSRWGLPCRDRCRSPRCALTAPFHPCCHARAGASAVCFLWHFPWGHPRRPLAATVFPWSPDFPPPTVAPLTAVARPTGKLAIGEVWHEVKRNSDRLLKLSNECQANRRQSERHYTV